MNLHHTAKMIWTQARRKWIAKHMMVDVYFLGVFWNTIIQIQSLKKFYGGELFEALRQVGNWNDINIQHQRSKNHINCWTPLTTFSLTSNEVLQADVVILQHSIYCADYLCLRACGSPLSDLCIDITSKECWIRHVGGSRCHDWVEKAISITFRLYQCIKVSFVRDPFHFVFSTVGI